MSQSQKSNVDYPHAITARLWEPIQPVDRGNRYEDPLADELSRREQGTVDGGGSSLSAEGEIQFADIELRLVNLDDALHFARSLLESMGAPVGSELLIQRDGSKHTVPFGVAECLAIYLDGATLPDEVYAESDVNDLVEQVENAAAPKGGQFRSYWEGPTETALYLYGPSAEAMLVSLESLLASYPLCQNARIVVRHGNPALQPRTFRVPRQRDDA